MPNSHYYLQIGSNIPYLLLVVCLLYQLQSRHFAQVQYLPNFHLVAINFQDHEWATLNQFLTSVDFQPIF